MKGNDHFSMTDMNGQQTAASPLKKVSDSYFAIKGALVKRMQRWQQLKQKKSPRL
ncbi:hypothetical protein [Chryseobacterium sp.]|uniref:hypothetical protein n=1 Tax=Chryseobacterium sp. TaxID=1871047 RepID=UPI0025C4DD85|nr:hypothetical protein [Chryseobacterium sp.]